MCREKSPAKLTGFRWRRRAGANTGGHRHGRTRVLWQALLGRNRSTPPGTRFCNGRCRYTANADRASAIRRPDRRRVFGSRTPRRRARIRVHYSNSLTPKFAEVAEGIGLLLQGEDPNLPLELDRTHCAQCSRLLPEKGGICPGCIRKRDTLKRLLSYMTPYKARALLLVGLTLVTALIELVPPYIAKHIIDDVLTGTVISASCIYTSVSCSG